MGRKILKNSFYGNIIYYNYLNVNKKMNQMAKLLKKITKNKQMRENFSRTNYNKTENGKKKKRSFFSSV